MLYNLRNVVAIFSVMLVAGCSALPRGSAVDTEILSSVDDPEADFAIYPVTRAFLPSVDEWPKVSGRSYNWIGHSHGSAVTVIQSGDTVNLRVWDSEDNSLLNGPGQPFSDLVGNVVSPNGTIFLPYVGKVKVSDRTPDSARSAIQRSLEAVSPSVQVQLTVEQGRQSEVDLVGGVARPGSFPMEGTDYSVLSLIAAGGGVQNSLGNPQIRLIRGHEIYGTSIDALYDNPKLDTRLRGGDKVIIEADERYFLSLGAAGTEALHAFPKGHVSALDAMSIVGGVNDSRADLQGILILREYPNSAVRPGVRGPRETRVVFTIDLASSDGLFSARNFEIQNKDLVLVTESPINNTRTILSLVGSAFGVVSAATN
ncbi:MAG: polysaccharide biosynthesis/export family protein [Lentilitoribacter sp.]